ncbi:MAG: hypothetical protein WAO35_14065 [Terriglobia bacterium]
MADDVYHVHLPPMPNPENFGITADTWRQANNGVGGAKAQIETYKLALKTWREAAEAIGPSGTKSR